ncbi:MAG: hypothetical protein D6713_02660, partial [Deltaproteobacteria bacterium]
MKGWKKILSAGAVAFLIAFTLSHCASLNSLFRGKEAAPGAGEKERTLPAKAPREEKALPPSAESEPKKLSFD